MYDTRFPFKITNLENGEKLENGENEKVQIEEMFEVVVKNEREESQEVRFRVVDFV